MKGRPPNVQPTLAFERRRYLTLVQVLAMEGSDEPIRALCEKWGIEPVEDRSQPPYRERYYLNQWATIRKLAQHVVEYHRGQE